jgi:Rod binding domain-containing protein
MSSISDVPAPIASQGLFENRADQLAERLARTKPADSKLKSFASQFESILIAKWLEEAENSFAKLPGDEEDAAADPGQDQFRSMALGFLAEGLSSAGGLGVAAMIVKHLEQRGNAVQGTDNKPVNGNGAAASPAATPVLAPMVIKK